MTDTKDPTEDKTIDARFDLPTFSRLSAKKQDLIRAYAVCLDKDMAAHAAGYRNKEKFHREQQVKKLFNDPEILKGIEEFLNAKLLQIDNGKAALANRLLYMSLASITDVAERVQRHNPKGEPIPNSWMWIPKDPESVEPHYLPAMSLMKCDARGFHYFDNMGQTRITNQLSALMMWDQQELDQSQPIVFQFGNIQQDAYEKPADSADANFADNDDGDEVDQLMH